MSDTTPPPLPPGYIDPEHQGEDRDLSEVFYLRGIRAVLTHRPTVAAVRVADASISDEALEAEFRAWWNPPPSPRERPGLSHRLYPRRLGPAHPEAGSAMTRITIASIALSCLSLAIGPHSPWAALICSGAALALAVLGLVTP
jgi:hypothetical protein